MLPLRCTTQSYDWGVPASQDSKVLALARANGVEAAVKNEQGDTRFAELWVGTHPSGAAQVLSKSGQPSIQLEQWLEQHPEALGRTVAELCQAGRPQGRLPFLMKVLSIDRALPLQAHPTSTTAATLHQKDPQTYPDAAHKPEMVVALNNFSGFAGFLAYDKMAQLLGRLPELTLVLGDGNVQDYLAAGPDHTQARQTALAGMFQQLILHTPSDLAAQVLDKALKRLQDQASGAAAALLPGGSQTAAAVENGAAAGSAAAQLQGGSSSSASAAVGGSTADYTSTVQPPYSGPSHTVGKSCDIAIAAGILSEPGGAAARDAMLAAAARAWPNDPAGVLALLLMEDVVLQQGEACLIPAGCPHAYICGEIMEIQAASNNTIKGGLTSDPLDRQSLVDIVTAGLAPPGGDTAGPASDAAVPPSGTLGDTGDASSTSTPAISEGLPPMILPTHPGGNLPEGSVEGLQLYQPGFGVEEFQAWHVVAQAGQKPVSIVMDPGPGALLVVGGAGHCSVKAGIVADECLRDEVELHPGTALFIPAGSSLSFTGTSNTNALDAWVTTANSRMFTAAAPAGSNQTPSTILTGDAAGKAAAHMSGVEPGDVFTAAEQVAAAVMTGAAGSSCPANADDASAAAMQTE